MTTKFLNQPYDSNHKHVDHARHSEVPELSAEGQCGSDEPGPRWTYHAAVDQFVSAFVILVSDFGAPQPVQVSLEHSVREFLSCSDEMTYWARAKNLVCFFKALYLRDSLSDVTGYKFVGHWKRWAKSRMHFNRRNTSLWASVFKLKNAACRLTERAAVVTMHKHSASIGKRKEASMNEVMEAIMTIEPVLDGCARAVQRDFEGGAWKVPPAASNSASYESSRKDFGQIGHFMHSVFGEGSPIVCPGLDFVGFGPQQRMCNGELLRDAPTFSLDGYNARLNYVMGEESPVAFTTTFYQEITIDGIRYENSWFDTYHFPSSEDYWCNEIMIQAFKAMDRDVALAKVAAVLEPFKVRIITKGEAALQYMSTHIQVSMHDYLRTLPCFRLIGKSPFTSDIEDIRDEMLKHTVELRRLGLGSLVDSLLVWGSADFSGASDGTVSLLRDVLLSLVLRFLPIDWQALGAACNGDHFVTYPGPFLYPSMVELGVPPAVLQQLGTLMGEKTSFVILCLEVLVAHVSALRRVGDPRSLDSILKSVLINGDDRLCLTTRDAEAEFWRFNKEYLGFEESKGKSYKHRRYANINSQSYICDLTGPCWKVPVRCSGLEWGQKKLDEPFDPTAVITQILDGCMDSAMEWTVLQRYFKRFEGALEAWAGGRCLFAHQSLGGCGARLPGVHGTKRCQTSRGPCFHRPGLRWKIAVTHEQLSVASGLALNSDLVPLYGPHLEMQVQPPELFRSPWNVYGKPNYWTAAEHVYKELSDQHKRLIREVGTRVTLDPGQLLCSRLVLQSQGSEAIRETEVVNFTWECPCGQTVSQDRDCCIGRQSRQCSVCELWSVGRSCDCCGSPYRGARAFRALSSILKRPSSHRYVPSGVNLSAVRLKRLGYEAPVEDEFDVALKTFVTQCHLLVDSDLELSPAPRYSGRGIDLWGEDPLWRLLKPSLVRW